jgi:hypothetical protein
MKEDDANTPPAPAAGLRVVSAPFGAGWPRAIRFTPRDVFLNCRFEDR